MALPSGVTTCTVTAGSALDFAGDDHTITVSWRPILGGPANLASAIVWAATGQPLINFSETVASEPGSQVSFPVPHVDQEGFVNAAGDAGHAQGRWQCDPDQRSCGDREDSPHRTP